MRSVGRALCRGDTLSKGCSRGREFEIRRTGLAFLTFSFISSLSTFAFGISAGSIAARLGCSAGPAALHIRPVRAGLACAVCTARGAVLHSTREAPGPGLVWLLASAGHTPGGSPLSICQPLGRALGALGHARVRLPAEGHSGRVAAGHDGGLAAVCIGQDEVARGRDDADAGAIGRRAERRGRLLSNLIAPALVHEGVPGTLRAPPSRILGAERISRS